MIGFGQARGKVVDKLVEYNRKCNVGIIRAAVTVDSVRADLFGLKNIPKDQYVFVGWSRVRGYDVGVDNELDAEIAEEDIDEIQGAIDSTPIHEVDVFLIVPGLDGGTGPGGTPVFTKHLKCIYTKPVYGFGILPGSDEDDIHTLDAARSFQTFVREVDNLLVFDDDAWRETGEPAQRGYDEVNKEIVGRFGVFFGAGEAQDGQEVVESVVDSSETINTLAGSGISMVDYAPEGIESRKNNGGGLPSRLTGGDEPDDSLDAVYTTNRITSLIRKAVLGRLILPCEAEGAERMLLMLAGPPEYLNRKGIERGQKWIEE